jgi:hypothetical protein
MNRIASTLLLSLLLLAPAAHADEVTDPARKKILLDALKSWYYSYGRTGFAGFTCDVHASVLDDLEKTLGEAGNSPAILKLVRSINTILTLDRHGEFTIESGKLALSGNKQADDGAQQALAGVKQSLQGVMNLWRPFVFGAYFAEDQSEFKVFDDNGAYTFVEPGSDVTMKLNTKFVIEEMTVGSGETAVTMRPTFTLTDKGFLVDHIDAKVGGLMNISLGFTYKQIRGVQLPTAIAERVEMVEGSGAPNAGTTLEMTIALTNHVAPKRN